MSLTSCWLGVGLMGVTVVGIPTVRMPRLWSAWRNSGSLIPEIPTQGMDAHTVWSGDEIKGVLHFVKQG